MAGCEEFSVPLAVAIERRAAGDPNCGAFSEDPWCPNGLSPNHAASAQETAQPTCEATGNPPSGAKVQSEAYALCCDIEFNSVGGTTIPLELCEERVRAQDPACEACAMGSLTWNEPVARAGARLGNTNSRRTPNLSRLSSSALFALLSLVRPTASTLAGPSDQQCDSWQETALMIALVAVAAASATTTLIVLVYQK